MTTVIKQTFETQIYLNEGGGVSIYQAQAGYNDYTGDLEDVIVSFPVECIDAVIQALQALKAE